MPANGFPKIRSLVQLYELLTEEERIITDVLRQVILDTIPQCKEKISYNVPFFFGNRSICLVWPASVPRGGIKNGVMLAFWYGNRLNDTEGYLTHGSNKQIFYKIFLSAGDIQVKPLVKILKEAASLDAAFSQKKQGVTTKKSR
jgi:Domain of unknown function (DU1801)